MHALFNQTDFTSLHLHSAEDMHDLDLRVAVDVEAMAAAARRPLSKADTSLIKCVLFCLSTTLALSFARLFIVVTKPIGWQYDMG